MQEQVSILTQLLQHPAGPLLPPATAHLVIASSTTDDPQASRNLALLLNVSLTGSLQPCECRCLGGDVVSLVANGQCQNESKLG